MRTKLSEAKKLHFSGKVDNRTALKFFQQRFFCELDGIWWVHLDRPIATQESRVSAIVDEVRRKINA